MDEEKRRIHLLKQKIGLAYFPSTHVRDAGVIHEGNRETWASLKRAEETYISQVPMAPSSAFNSKVGRPAGAEEMIRQSIASMREMTTVLLGESELAWELVAGLSRRLESFRESQERRPRSK